MSQNILIGFWFLCIDDISELIANHSPKILGILFSPAQFYCSLYVVLLYYIILLYTTYYIILNILYYNEMYYSFEKGMSNI